MGMLSAFGTALAGIGQAATSAMSVGFKVAGPVAGEGLALAGRTAGWAMRHPEATLMMGVAAGGVGLSMSMRAGTSEISQGEASQLAVMTGSSTGFTPGMGSMAFDPNRMGFQDSATGLTLGLWRGRHG